jgi:hypothetical protein
MNRTTITIGLAAVLVTAGTGAAVAATGSGSAGDNATRVVSAVRSSDDAVTHDRFDDRVANAHDRRAEHQARRHGRHRHVEAGDDRGAAVEPVEAGDDRGRRGGSGSDDGSGHHDGRDG